MRKKIKFLWDHFKSMREYKYMTPPRLLFHSGYQQYFSNPSSKKERFRDQSGNPPPFHEEAFGPSARPGIITWQFHPSGSQLQDAIWVYRGNRHTQKHKYCQFWSYQGAHPVILHGDKFQKFNGDNFKSVRTLVQKTVLDATLTLHKYLNFFPSFSSFNYESPELTFIILCRNLIKYIPTFMLLNNQIFKKKFWIKEA